MLKSINIFFIIANAWSTVLELNISSPIITKNVVFNICKTCNTLDLEIFNLTYNLLNSGLVILPIDIMIKWYKPNKIYVHPAPCHKPLSSQTTKRAIVPLNNGP